MKDVRVNTEKLKERVAANREMHQKEFLSALEGWAKEVTRLMQADIAALDAGERRRLTSLDPMPDNHTGDYDRVLEMLEMSVDEIQTMDMPTFRQYVLDDWSWKGHWVASTSKYNSGLAD